MRKAGAYFNQMRILKMTNLDKLTAAGKIVFGDKWQNPFSRLLGIYERSMRRYVAGKSRPPYTDTLIEALERKKQQIESAIELVKSDAITGDYVTTDFINDIVSQYSYADEQARKAAIDAVNNAVYEVTYLSDLHQIASKFSELGYVKN